MDIERVFKPADNARNIRHIRLLHKDGNVLQYTQRNILDVDKCLSTKI